MKSFLQIAAGIDAWLLASIKFTYAAGLCCGLIYRRWLHPLVLAMVATAKLIDWPEVGLIVRAGLVALVGLTWAGVVTAHQLLVLVSAALGRRYAALLVGGGGGANPAAPAAAAPVVAKAKPKPKRRHGRAGGLVLA